MGETADVRGLEYKTRRELSSKGKVDGFGIRRFDLVVQAPGDLLNRLAENACRRSCWEAASRRRSQQDSIQAGGRDVVQSCKRAPPSTVCTLAGFPMLV